MAFTNPFYKISPDGISAAAITRARYRGFIFATTGNGLFHAKNTSKEWTGGTRSDLKKRTVKCYFERSEAEWTFHDNHAPWIYKASLPWMLLPPKRGGRRLVEDQPDIYKCILDQTIFEMALVRTYTIRPRSPHPDQVMFHYPKG